MESKGKKKVHGKRKKEKQGPHGLCEAERQTQGSNCQGISVKESLCRKSRGTGGNGSEENKLSEDGI